MAIKSKYGYYPNNFNLDGFCIKNSLPPEKVVKILDVFLRKPMGQEDGRTLKLNATILKRSVGDVYKNILECLLVNGIIENTYGYEVGVKSREYQLTDYYYNADGVNKYSVESKPLNPALELSNNVKHLEKFVEDSELPKVKRTVRLPSQIFEEDYRFLIKWFRDGELSIDAKLAHSIIQEHNINVTEPDKYHSYLIMVDIFEEKDFHLKADLNHRLYSSITNLPKFLRGCLRYGSEELIGIDVSNTQPLILSVICESNFLENLYLELNIDVKPVKLLRFIKYLKSNPVDLSEYKKLVESGMLYESFIDVAPHFDRTIVKSCFIKIINDKGINRLRDVRLIRDAFNKKFPTISMLLDILKSIDHRYSSWILMTKEAQMFLFDFANKFSHNPKFEHIPLFTIHDCFMTTKSNGDLLEAELKHFFQEKYKINIPLKREEFAPSTS
jgi:hypothetical protein